MGLDLISRAIQALLNLRTCHHVLVKQLSIGPFITEPIRQLFSANLRIAEHIYHVDCQLFMLTCQIIMPTFLKMLSQLVV